MDNKPVIKEAFSLYKKALAAEKDYEAIKYFDQALVLYELGGPDFKNVLGEIHFLLGNCYFKLFDFAEAEYHYKFSLEVYTSLNETNRSFEQLLCLAKTNYKNRRYKLAFEWYEKAYQIATLLSDQECITTIVEQSEMYQQSHNFKEEAGLLEKRLGQLKDIGLVTALRPLLLESFARCGEFELMEKKATIFLGQIDKANTRPEIWQMIESLKINAQNILKNKGKVIQSKIKPLDALSSGFLNLKKQKDYQGVFEIGSLICDVFIANLETANDEWRNLTSHNFLERRIISEIIEYLFSENFIKEGLELSQRMKALSFCIPNISLLYRSKELSDNEMKYLKAHKQLKYEVDLLQKSYTNLGPLMNDNIRKYGEQLMEVLEEIKEEDILLFAKLGGLIYQNDLVDGLPAFGETSGIIDLNVVERGTFINLFYRTAGKVNWLVLFAESFSQKDAIELINDWQNIPNTGDVGILKICHTLHTKLMFPIDQQLEKLHIKHLIIIPDHLTRFLPFHISLQKKTGASDIGYLIDNYAIEYSSCLNAFCVSQYLRKPKKMDSVLGIFDGKNDLPGARFDSKKIKEILPPSIQYTELVGNDATLEKFRKYSQNSNLLFFGTHGYVNYDEEEVSSIIFNDKRWSIQDIIGQDIFVKGPFFSLLACDVGRAAPGFSLTAQGIPNALISKGAAGILASIWGISDISNGFFLNYFIYHLNETKNRPAVALKKAVSDFRKLSKHTILKQIDAVLKNMKEDGSRDKFPKQYIEVDNFYLYIQNHQSEFPFDDFMNWGNYVIYGNGWHTEAHSSVYNDENIYGTANYVANKKQIDEALIKGNFDFALTLLNAFLIISDGITRIAVLCDLASIQYDKNKSYAPEASKWKARKVLAKAMVLSKAENAKIMIAKIQEIETRLNA